MLAILAKAGGWLLKNPAIAVTAFVTVAFILVHVSDNRAIALLTDQIENPTTGYKAVDARRTAAIATLRNNNATLADSVATQNTAFEDLKLQGQVATGKFDTIIAGMAAANATTSKKLDAINKAQPGPDKCASALALIKGSAQ